MSPTVLSLSLTLSLGLALPWVAYGQAVCASEHDRLEDALHRLREDDFEGAERALLRALRSCPTEPALLGLLGLAQSRTGHLVDAEGHLQAALASPQHFWIAANRGVLEHRLEELQDRLGSLVVTANVPEAVLVLPDERRLVLPLTAPVRVPAGNFTVRVHAPGYREVVRDVEVIRRSVRQEHFELQRRDETPLAPALRYLRDERTVTHAPSPWRTVGVATAGVGAALLVAGAVQLARSIEQGAATQNASPFDSGRYGAWATWRQGFAADATADELCAAAQSATAGHPGIVSEVRALCSDNATTRATAIAFGIAGVLLTGAGVTLAALAGERVTVETSTPRVLARIDRQTQGVWMTIPF